MPRRVVRLRDEVLSADGETLRAGIAAIQAELDVTPQFPPKVEQAAQQAAKNPRLPDLDRTDLPFVTIDPATAMDLDQALHIERKDDGFVVSYAIADVGAFVSPGDPIDEEAHRRGATLYGADSKVPLYPKALSEDAASLLADQVRPALLWTIELDGDGGTVAARVERARVRSRAKLSYTEVQEQLDAGTADPVFALLKEVGELRLAKEAERGGVSLPLPEQEVRIDGEHWSLAFRQQHPVEQWNAQISLLTGMTAAAFMVEARTGLLRTLAPADPRDVKRLRRTAKALRIDWPDGQSYPDFVRSLDPATPSHAAMLVACTRLLRGSGYVGFAGELPEHTGHSAIAADYAHVTAPLRRLVDRYAGEISVALSAGHEVPGWVVDRLGELPKTMQGSTRRANQYERAVLDLVEAAVLHEYVGESFDGVVVEVSDRDARKGDVTIREPAVEASISDGADLPLGTDVRARLAAADPSTRTIRFELA
ncbi:RNB domain-containing ribonuclease [Jiangella endophytica]|uniref:RNB domain-containing ribonuclease n=1 Tax=Jiangella endophytica TaxID=1623398 RepID=UPI0018E59C06|nr:RNB domain-containing ribonuclease [Jiangella endophytica]